ncbi:neutral/alkaline non-lysosomal ceramidase N-terminal domain-containing protein [Rudanella lutea]|uniref:neutral/alkaline non-lysosomal ceramidase N-terminal domain-containing protein n=1 Tax=Rudanella lutea TaxID=451374 RepID=UPI00036C8E0B|nr:neutral/alkaline non-lysosomal ceramidase N-terminal domain-containing protein [Rudanella lutea]
MKHTSLVVSLLLTFLFAISANAQGWKAGVARAVITPQGAIWQGGYASRTHASDGKLHDLCAKALALQDANGKRAVLVTTDLLGFPKPMSDRIRQRLQQSLGLAKADVILNSSHTHSGPVLGKALQDIYPVGPPEQATIDAYTRWLEDQVVQLVTKAFADLEPAELFSQNGVTRFQVNRRNNKEASLREQTELRGPNDYAVPVLKVLNRRGVLKAVAFGYACHPTVLDLYQLSGDWPGFAQLELEKTYPGATALFFQGAAGDQNPLPRRTIPLARQYGREMAVAVERVLDEPMRALPAQLGTAYAEIDLKLNPVPSDADLTRLTTHKDAYMQRWATRMLAEKKAGVQFISSYPYPVQVWNVGGQSLFSFGGELVIEYALEIKKRFGPDAFVLAYSNDVMGYVPSETILKEGGYEGDSSQMVYGLPSTWTTGLQAQILAEVERLAGPLGLTKAAPK